MNESLLHSLKMTNWIFSTLPLSTNLSNLIQFYKNLTICPHPSPNQRLFLRSVLPFPCLSSSPMMVRFSLPPLYDLFFILIKVVIVSIQFFASFILFNCICLTLFCQCFYFIFSLVHLCSCLLVLSLSMPITAHSYSFMTFSSSRYQCKKIYSHDVLYQNLMFKLTVKSVMRDTSKSFRHITGVLSVQVDVDFNVKVQYVDRSVIMTCSEIFFHHGCYRSFLCQP